VAYQGWGLVGVRRDVDEESSGCGCILGSTWHDAAWGSHVDLEGHPNIDPGGSFSFVASVPGVAASSWVQRVAFAYTSVQDVLAESLGGSWDVLVRNLDQAVEWGGQGNEAVHGRGLVKRTWAPAEPSLRSCKVR